MIHVLLTLQFDGTQYHGWQVQPNAKTVQETLQDAVQQITGVRSAITGCSRTDAGVHAKNFYCTLSVADTVSPARLQQGLNAVLPPDIAVLDWRTVPEHFHPRYQAVAKRYEYRIWNSPVKSPFEVGRSLHVRTPLDETSLNHTAQLFMGTHDFTAFCAAGSSVHDKVRTVRLSQVKREDALLTYTVEADGFLYNMVRIFVGTLLDVSAGKLTEQQVKEALATGNRDLAGKTAPPQGLFLDRVWYDESAFADTAMQKNGGEQ